jgi:MFS family permease
MHGLKRNDYLAAFEAFAMYLLTGAACIILGSSMSQLIGHYHSSLNAIAAFISAFSLGRLVTVFGTGYLTERIGTKWVFAAGTILLAVYLVGVPQTSNYYLGIFFCALGGAGVGAQDACCPVILNKVFPKSYASAMSAGQALFCAGCFLAPMIMSRVLSLNLMFSYAFYAAVVLAIVMLAVLPFVKLPAAICAGEKGAPTEDALKLHNKVLGYIVLVISCMAYCAATNTICTFSTTFGESIGMSSASANSLLSAYNVGCMLGSVLFIAILKKVKGSTVLWCNIGIALIMMGIAVLIDNIRIYYVALFLTGCCMGVLFSVYITIATRLNPEHASIAAAGVAVACGLADMIAPLAVSAIVTANGASTAYIVAIVLLAVCLFTSVLLKIMIKSNSEKIEIEGL